MTRLDQLATPTRRRGEHISAVVERERQEHIDALQEANDALDKSAKQRNKSRSMTHLASLSTPRSMHQRFTGTATTRPLRKSNTTKSMTQLVTAKLTSTKFNKQPTATLPSNRKFNKDSEIDSTTTNVSPAPGVCYTVIHSLLYGYHPTLWLTLRYRSYRTNVYAWMESRCRAAIRIRDQI